MDLTQEYWWKVLLELKLRKVSGDAFQNFFSDVMHKCHGDDFVRLRPFGSKGDKGCDGYLQSSGQVFQCYGAINGDGGKVNYLIGKMKEDFEKAKEKLPSIMKEWCMVHNLVDGLPIDAVEVLEELKKENSDIKFGFIGLEGIERRISALDRTQVESLLGPVATNLDARNLQIEELRELVSAVAKGAESMTATSSPIEPVPADKLDANDLPGHWRSLIAGGWQNAHLVASYLDRHPEPLVGERIARLFNEKYQYFKAQHLSPGAIMNSLYEFVTGAGTVSPERQVAAQALLAHLFESCDIFENVTEEITA
ncbi:ABC-three component system protein [Marinobacterium litorale]|uniref:ABC-three component system protein n=1 Tax=Marinobacterium litorale TaxID=404770 RepID=UPI00041BF5B8|nr:ABC-three component system protein [Marinobacterium litorale]